MDEQFRVVMQVLVYGTDMLERLDARSLRSLRQVNRYCAQHVTDGHRRLLMHHQVDHYQRMLTLLRRVHAAVDVSLMGCGKTYVAAMVARHTGWPLLVVGPPMSRTTWERASAHCDVPLYFYTHHFVYSGSVPVSERREEGLIENVYDAASETSSKQATAYFWETFRNGVLLVYDEAHMLKNSASERSKVCVALSRALRTTYSEDTGALRVPHRILALSSTPYDTPECSVQFMRLLGVVTSHALLRSRFDKKSHDRRFYHGGLREVYEYVVRATEDETLSAQIPRKLRWHERQRHRGPGYIAQLHRVIVDHVVPSVFLAMPSTRANRPDLRPDVSEKMISIEDADAAQEARDGQALCTNAIRAYEQAKKDGSLSSAEALRIATTTMRTRVLQGLQMIEEAKRGIFVREAVTALETNPNAHVIIMVNFLATLDTVRNALRPYDPLVICGKVTQPQRRAILKDYALPDTRHRLLLCTIGTCTQSIDLDDKHGDYPRFVLLSPSFKHIQLHQASGRTLRCDTRSPSVVWHVYCSEAPRENEIIRAVQWKRNHMRSLLPYEIEVEEVKLKTSKHAEE